MSPRTIPLESLLQYRPLDQLEQFELDVLAASTLIKSARKGTRLLEVGSGVKKTLYLINGHLKLTAQDGKSFIIDSNSARAKEPISHLVPHKYTVNCMSDVEYMWIENRIVRNALDKPHGAIVTHLAEGFSDTVRDPLVIEISELLAEDRLKLPVLPDVAMQANKVLQEDGDLTKAARVIMQDPVLSAHIIRVANSAIYRASKLVSNVAEAIQRIGVAHVRTHVHAYVLRNVFKDNSPLSKKFLQQLWSYSVEVAANSYVLANKLGKFSKSEAMSLGLEHAIGAVPVVNYICQEHPEVAKLAVLQELVHKLTPEISMALMAKWNFHEDYFDVAANVFNWEYSHEGDDDYSDLLIIARFFTLIGKRNVKDSLVSVHHMPPQEMGKIPAFHRLGIDQDPEMCSSVLAAGKRIIDEFSALLVA
ncbi:MAG: HDOD domain-containing protein [Gammaproteobacteria bacterium]|nr:HDOD domain-containing protein [Gammaproteobacteria bacterium]